MSMGAPRKAQSREMRRRNESLRVTEQLWEWRVVQGPKEGREALGFCLRDSAKGVLFINTDHGMRLEGAD